MDVGDFSATGRTTWRVAAASVQGTSHRRTGVPCQDAHASAVLEDGTLVAAVADGAGSASLSDVGARTACRAAVEALGTSDQAAPSTDDEADWSQVLRRVFEKARDAIAAEAESRDVTLKDLATTLIVVRARPDLVVAGQVGDGACVLRDASGGLTPLTTPNSGEYVNETSFLTGDDALESFAFGCFQGDATHVALLSDGLQRLALEMPEGKPHPGFFDVAFRFVRETRVVQRAIDELASFLGSDRVGERTDDDVTLLLAAHGED